jgi:general secretion pathway protein C
LNSSFHHNRLMKFSIAKSAESGSNKASITWTLRVFTLLIWLLVGLCAAYWAFKFVTTKPVEATAALAAPTGVVDSKAVGKLLGATDAVAGKPANTPASTKFVLFGLASSAGGQGVALIALDGKPAKPYRVGSAVADDLLLKSISKTGVMLATSLQAADGVTLELPARKPANIGPIATLANPGAANPTGNPSGNPSFNPSVPPFVPPVLPPVMPSAAVIPPQVPAAPVFTAPMPPGAILPSASGTAAAAAGLSDRPAAISRFAPRTPADGAPAMPATSSAVGER